MEDLNLVEYDPSYAKLVADMWGKSSEGWNGDNVYTTEESVLKGLECSTSINVYLAEKGGEILGLCDFSQYLEDEGALYIKLLNVRYDYHGLGIGRTLVCKAVDRTVELGWPRLDLYTWPGNTKSIPLYKRCGFFLENRDDTTHLMNFIPYVLETEAVKEYFKSIHWYKDLKRTIDMEPDGREENGFDFYEYLWEKEEVSLRMEFERKGRGLRLIETEDYFIAANLPQQNLVFGQKYKVSYEIKNKTGKPLCISIKGVDNKNIKFDFEATREVKEKEIIEGEFYVGEFSEEPNIFRTHPVVASEVFINGKRAEFKLGIVPKLPVEISLVGTDAITYNCNPECYKDIESKIYLDIENSFNDKACFKFQLINNKSIEFLNRDIQIDMEAKEKKSLEINYILKNHCFYSETILVNALLRNGTRLEFKKTLTSVFKGRDGAFGGEGKDYFIINNGAYSAKLNKFNNKIYLRAFENENEKIFFNIPKLGKPYSAEFSNIKPKKVIWYKEEEWMVLKATYISEVFTNLEVTTVVKVAASGIVEHYYEIHNNSATKTSRGMFILQGNYHSMGNGVIPMDNKYVKIKSSNLQALHNFNMDKLTENWFFSKTKALTKGLCWNKDLKPKMNDWMVGFEHKLGDISPGATVIIPSIKAALNTFNNWKQFRDYVLGIKCLENINEVDDLEIVVNKGNPFVNENFTVEVIEHKQQNLQGDFLINSEVMGILNLNKTISDEEETKSTEIVIKTKENIGLDILKIECDLNLTFFKKRNAFFVIKNSGMKKEIIEEEGRQVYCFDNGVINIRLCPSFSPALYSMVYKNNEWLANSYPTPRSKSWFNPWVGGILNAPQNLSLRSILEEKIEAEFTTLRDSCGNEWEGIRTYCSINHNNEYKGLILNEYFLMLPGVPVLCHISRIIQNMGRFMNEEPFENYSFFMLDEDIKKDYLLIKNKDEEYVKYKSGKEGADIATNGSILLGSKNFKEKLQVYTNSQKVKSIGFVGMHDTAVIVTEKVTAAHKKKVFTSPVFYIFTNEFIEDKLLADLRNVYFE